MSWEDIELVQTKIKCLGREDFLQRGSSRDMRAPSEQQQCLRTAWTRWIWSMWVLNPAILMSSKFFSFTETSPVMLQQWEQRCHSTEAAPAVPTWTVHMWTWWIWFKAVVSAKRLQTKWVTGVLSCKSPSRLLCQDSSKKKKKKSYCRYALLY